MQTASDILELVSATARRKMLLRTLLIASPLSLTVMAATVLADDAVWTGKFWQLEEEKPHVSLWGCEYLVDNKYPRILIFEDFCPSTADTHRYDHEQEFQKCCVKDAGQKKLPDGNH